MSKIGPGKGYRIKVGTSTMYQSIGDQNDDGVPDMVVMSTISSNTRAFVVYGVSDPTTLAPCDVGSVDHCLDLASLTSSQGYEITSSVEPTSVSSAGDFDGDGTRDIGIGTDGNAFVLKGAVRTADVDLQAAVGTEAIQITGPSGQQFGGFVSPVSDLNGDGKDEVGIMGGIFAGGGDYVILGSSLSGTATPIDSQALAPSDGFFIATAPLGVPQPANTGDLNGDGRDDLMIGYINLGAATAGEVSIVYMPELPTTDVILAGDDLEPGDGYVFKPGGAPAALGLGQSVVGDIDGDGLTDQFLSATATPGNGFDAAGAAYLVR
jgi:hypothetical protein